jgi:hypothetical protein
VRPKTAAEKAFCALGRVAEAFISGAAATGATRLGAGLAELNTLRAAHGEQAFPADLDRAVAFSRPHLGDAGHLLMRLDGGGDIHEPSPSTGVHGVEFVSGPVVADRSPATSPGTSSSARSKPAHGPRRGREDQA